MMTTAQRIPNVPEHLWTDEVKAVFPIMVPEGAPVKGSDFNSILMLATNPEMAGHWFRFNAGLNAANLIPIRTKEIAILRAAWHYQCEYEWVHHALSGVRAGLSPAEIHLLTQGSAADNPGWSEKERWVIRLADDFCDHNRGASAATWAGLSAHYSQPEIMEVMFVTSAYIALGLVFNSGTLQLEPSFREAALGLGLPMIRGA